MSDEREMIYVCTRVADSPSHVPSLQRECSKCEAAVWVSVRMQRDPKVVAMKILCTQCAYPEGPPTPRELVRGMVKGEVVLHPIALDEVRRHVEGEEEGAIHD